MAQRDLKYDLHDELDQVSKLLLIHTLCRMQSEFTLKPWDLGQLFRIVQVIASEPDDQAKPVEIDRVGTLTRALKTSFTIDHPVWSFVRWAHPKGD